MFLESIISCILPLLKEQFKIPQKQFHLIIIPMGLNSIQNNAILIKRRVPTPKWMLLVGFQVLTNLRLFCVQTGEAILFLLIPLIEKGKKRYNQTSKSKKQAQNPNNYWNNFESCHNNAPPFLCNTAICCRLGGYHPVMCTLLTWLSRFFIIPFLSNYINHF